MSKLSNDTSYIIAGEGVQNICIKEKKIVISFHHFFLNMDSSFNIYDRQLKFSVNIIDVLMEGTVSHICLLGPRSSFMRFQK